MQNFARPVYQGSKQLFWNLLKFTRCFQKPRYLVSTGYFVEIEWKYWTKRACNVQDIAGYSLQPAPIFNPICDAQ